MYINKIDVSWFNHPFIGNSFLLRNEKDFAKLKKSKATYVIIDTEKGFYKPSENKPDKPENQRVIKNKGISLQELSRLDDKVPLHEEIKVARKIYQKSRKVIENVFNDVKKGKPIDLGNAFKTIDSMTDSILRNKDAFLSLSVVKGHDNYTFYHSMNVCTLCLTMGRYLCFSKEDLLAIGMGALLHDIGKIKIPLSILNKPGKLTEEEFAVMKKHAEYSSEILSHYSSLRWDSINLAYEHHERFDGSGYPLNLKGDRINQFALIAAIADVFDALTTDRPYREAMPVDVAMEKIFQWGEKDFAPPLVEKFVQCMGVYPISTIVELDNNEIGLVASINHSNLERPKLIGILDKNYIKLKKPKIIDLASDEYHRIFVKRCFDRKNLGMKINTAKLLEDFTNNPALHYSPVNA